MTLEARIDAMPLETLSAIENMLDERRLFDRLANSKVGASFLDAVVAVLDVVVSDEGKEPASPVQLRRDVFKDRLRRMARVSRTDSRWAASVLLRAAQALSIDVPEEVSEEELLQQVARTVSEDLEERIRNASDKDKRQIENAITSELEQMPAHVRENLRSQLNVEDLTGEAVFKALVSGGLTTAMFVGLESAGFALYLAITSTLHAAATAAGVTLPFSAYTTATSATSAALQVVPFLIPLSVVWSLSRSARKIDRTLLPPTLAAISAAT